MKCSVCGIEKLGMVHVHSAEYGALHFCRDCISVIIELLYEGEFNEN